MNEYYKHKGGGIHTGSGGCHSSLCGRVVVIDPEDSKTIEALVEAWNGAEWTSLDNKEPLSFDGLRMRVALKSLIAPAKPDEPQGLGAVVEEADGTRRYREDNGRWAHNGISVEWVDVAAVKVLSEGVA